MPVSAGVQAPAEMPRSGNKVMSKQRSELRISVLTRFYITSFEAEHLNWKRNWLAINIITPDGYIIDAFRVWIPN